MSEPKCSVCDWTTVSLLNLGEPLQTPKWVCHGCIKRRFDEISLGAYDTYWSRRALVMQDTLQKVVASATLVNGLATTCCITTQSMLDLKTHIATANDLISRAECDTGKLTNPPTTF
jgi:hypothetical protein